VLTEQSAYSNRWRHVSPVAKGCFSLCGIIAAFAAGSPCTALLIASILASVTVFGAGVPITRYMRVAAPALIFLLASGLSLFLSFSLGASISTISPHIAFSELRGITHTCCRSLTCLTALLFLALTTPLSDIISLLRLCRLPETLLDLMTLCYRTLFVLSEAVHETMTAQTARLGYASFSISLRSLGGLFANLIVQVWQRSLALHLAAQARGNDGSLRFLRNNYNHSCRNISIAATTGCLMIALTIILP
jgi:cobalt/nickel transport system permease protein